MSTWNVQNNPNDGQIICARHRQSDFLEDGHAADWKLFFLFKISVTSSDIPLAKEWRSSTNLINNSSPASFKVSSQSLLRIYPKTLRFSSPSKGRSIPSIRFFQHSKAATTNAQCAKVILWLIWSGRGKLLLIRESYKLVRCELRWAPTEWWFIKSLDQVQCALSSPSQMWATKWFPLVKGWVPSIIPVAIWAAALGFPAALHPKQGLHQ